jgi:uncharacterized membrane protein
VIAFGKDIESNLINLYKSKKIAIEGNLLKVIKTTDKEFEKYLEEAKYKDQETRRKRLEVTKQVQQQNRDLIESQAEKEKLMLDLQQALEESEKLRAVAVDDLETLQKKTQFELIGLIVKVALGAVSAICILTTILYIYVLSRGLDSKIIESTWSNMFGIILTNCFSIIGTIMGVKHITDSKDKK